MAELTKEQRACVLGFKICLKTILSSRGVTITKIPVYLDLEDEFTLWQLLEPEYNEVSGGQNV